VKKYNQAPLPFQGQKRRFYLAFKDALTEFSTKKVFVDLFGGSGFLSHTVKQLLPDAIVILNDFDDYHIRLANIERTNAILSDIRIILKNHPFDKKIGENDRVKILERIAKEEDFVDYITLSSNLLFSMKYVTTFQQLTKHALYNNVRLNEYPICKDYLQDVEVVKMDYKELYTQYKNVPDVVFLVDPPYLFTDTSTYSKANSWKLSDYLDVLDTIKNSSYFYFTSNNSEIIELCDWMGKSMGVDNPFRNAVVKRATTSVNYNSNYTDIMLYRKLC
jgi:adenine-specific DNA methylase